MKRYMTILKSRQSGLAVVEATIVLPLLLLMMLAIAEFGRALYQYNTLTRAVRAASQIPLISEVESGAGREGRLKNLIVYGSPQSGGTPILQGLTVDDVVVTYPTIDGDGYYKIDVSYDWVPIFGSGLNTFFGGFISLEFPLKTSMTVREL